MPERGYRFEKIFTDGVFMAGGVLEVHRASHGRPADDADSGQAVQGAQTKSRQLLRACSSLQYRAHCVKIMYLTQGVLRVRVHRTVFTLAAGGLFMVPYDTVSCLALTPDRRGNVYELDNIGATTARIVFTQVRRPCATASDSSQAREVKVAEGELDSDAVAELEGELSLR